MKEKQNSLLANFESLKDILNISPLGVTILEQAHTNPLFVNSTLLHSLGYNTEKILPADISKIFPSTLFLLLQDRLSKLSTNDRHFLDEVKFITKDGQIRFFNICSDVVTIYKRELIISYYRDVTEKIHTQTLLARSESCLRAAQEVAKMGNWEWNLYDKPYYSEELLKIYNFSSSNQFTFDAFIKLLHPEDKERVTKIVGNALYNFIPYGINYRIVLPSGQVKYLHSIAEAFTNEAGVPFKMVGTVQDVTDQVQTQKALERSEKALKEAQRIAKVGSWEWDILEDKRYYSDELLNIFNFPPGSVYSYEQFIDYYHPEDKERVVKTVKEAIQHHTPFDITHRIVLPHAELKYLHATSKLFTNEGGNPVKMIGTIQDITQQVLAKKELEKSEKRLNRAQQIGRMGYWEWNIVRDEVYWSDALYLLYERPKGEFIPTIHSVIEMMPEAERKRLTDYISTCLQTKQTHYQIEGQIITKAAKRLHFLAIAEIIYDAAGNPLRMEGISQDITNMKKVEADLEFKDYLLQNVNDAIFSTDTQLTITSWNKAAEKIYGWTEKEALGSNLYQLLNLNPPNPAAHQAFFDKGYFKGIHSIQKKDGSKVVIDAHSILLRNEMNELAGMVSVDRDITAFSEMQTKAQQSEYMLQLVLDTIPQAIYWKDLDLLYQGCNNNFVKILELSHASEVLGKRDKDLYWGAEGTPILGEQDEQLINGHIAQLFYTKLIKTKTGNSIWLDIKRAPLLNEEKQIIGIFGSLEDITQKKLIEEALQNNRANLEAIIENTNDLILAIDKNFLILAMNSNLARFWRTHFGVSLQIGENFAEAQPQWLQIQWLSAFKKVLTGQKIYFNRRFRLDNKYYWFDISCFPIIESNGQIRGASYTVRDVTERKKQEIKLIRFIKEHSRLKLEQEKRQMLAVVKGQEEERQIISMELHDGVGQILTALHFKASKLTERLSSATDPDITTSFDELIKLQKNIYNEVRRISENLMPQFLNDFSLQEALRQLTIQTFSNTGIMVESEYKLGNSRLEKSLEIALFRITQEIFNNILKHSHATRVAIHLQTKKSTVMLSIQDNGVGSVSLTDDQKRGKGMNNIRQRVNLLNGSFIVSSFPGKGFQILINIPIH